MYHLALWRSGDPQGHDIIRYFRVRGQSKLFFSRFQFSISLAHPQIAKWQTLFMQIVDRAVFVFGLNLDIPYFESLALTN